MSNSWTAKAALLVIATTISCDRNAPDLPALAKDSTVDVIDARAKARRGRGDNPEMDEKLCAQLRIDARSTCEILRAGTGVVRAGGEKEFKDAVATAERLCSVWAGLVDSYSACRPSPAPAPKP